MQDRLTESIRTAERLRLRADALSGAAVGLSAACRLGQLTADEVFQLLDVIADDVKRQADRLLDQLTSIGAMPACSTGGA